MNTKPAIIPVILCGGAGTRLWPMSRYNYPKQLLPLFSGQSLLQETLKRVACQKRYCAPIILTNEALRFAVAEQAYSVVPRINALILEPAARNTAPAITAAALVAASKTEDALLLVLPSDHMIQDIVAFEAAVDKAMAAASMGLLTTFSITPNRPETGFGYIHKGKAIPSCEGVFEAASFVEKPSSTRAVTFVESNEYFWNSGMFLFPAQALLSEIEAHAPDVLHSVRRAVEKKTQDLDFIRLDATAFSTAPSISIEYAVMEKTSKAATVPCSIGWSDIDSWEEFWAISQKDKEGNVLVGDAVVRASRNCLIHSKNLLTCAVGVDNLAVIVTEDTVLVMDRNQSLEMKEVVELLIEQGRSETQNHVRVARPWGFYQGLHQGERFQVKRLTVNPGGRLSLQKHYHRAEHWVVVSGTAQITKDDTICLLQENESIYLPLGCVHRLENPGKIPLTLIEVQSGSYLGEDDIVRMDDIYGR